MINKITETRIIEQYLRDYGKRYYLRELAGLLKKPHQTVKPYAEKLVKERILTKEERKNVTDYFLNWGNAQTFDHLVIAEKKRLMRRLEDDIMLKTLFEKLAPFFSENIFVVFGSAVDDINKAGDIDLLVIGEKGVDRIAKNFEAIYSKKIHAISVKNIKDLDDITTREVYGKHLIFNGTETVIRFFGGLYVRGALV